MVTILEDPCELVTWQIKELAEKDTVILVTSGDYRAAWELKEMEEKGVNLHIVPKSRVQEVADDLREEYGV